MGLGAGSLAAGVQKFISYQSAPNNDGAQNARDSVPNERFLFLQPHPRNLRGLSIFFMRTLDPMMVLAPSTGAHVQRCVMGSCRWVHAK
jgi:hypothetical protein